MGVITARSQYGSITDSEGLNLEVRAKDLSKFSDRKLLSDIVHFEVSLGKIEQHEKDFMAYTEKQVEYEGEDYAIMDLFRQVLKSLYTEFDRRHSS